MPTQYTLIHLRQILPHDSPPTTTHVNTQTHAPGDGLVELDELFVRGGDDAAGTLCG